MNGYLRIMNEVTKRSISSKVSSKWTESTVLTVKKSKFKGYCIAIHDRKDIPQALQGLMEIEKALKKATHPQMYAFKIGNSPSNSDSPLRVVDQGYHDDGEGGAGLRLQGLLDRTKLVNILIVVARWYGGTPLGSSRFRCISDVATECLQLAGYLTNRQKISNDNLIDFTIIDKQ
ncbi:hypothetical protein DASC09_013310 [Saccharomycopsis crataegensis]|uniref:Impact N-terminal domain-containing protein n=1 Tax=Saccharomycopsis crataegensis TaxID=43959 RepID=A0AAV5QHB3_9ASCO|nr:hypothetical protein DASC09_013310 [Saccharomycopsis crataegensis]